MYTCDNLPENTFGYRVTSADFAGTSSSTELIANVAQRFNVDMLAIYNHVFDPQQEVSEPNVRVGDILPIPGSMPLHYPNPCGDNQNEAGLLEIVALNELIELVTYAEILAIGLTATPETIHNPNESTFLDSVSPIYLLSEGITLEQLNGEDGVNEILASTGLNDVELDGVDLPTALAVSTSPEFMSNYIVTGEIVVFPEFENLFNFNWEETEEINRLEDVGFVVQDALNNSEFDADTAIDIFSSRAIQHQDGVPNEDLGLTIQYNSALMRDEEFLATIQNLQNFFTTWNNALEADLLNTLQNVHIPRMSEHTTMNNVWLGGIISTFEGFASNMQARHDLLLRLKETVEYIAWLQLTPEQRIELAQKNRVREALSHCGLDVSSLTDDLPMDVFTATAEGLLSEKWETVYDCMSYRMDEHYYGDHRYRYSGSASDMIHGLIITIHEDPYVTENNQRRLNSYILFTLSMLPIVGLFIDLVDTILLIRSGNVSMAFLSALFSVFDIDEFFDIARATRRSFANLTSIGAEIADDFDDAINNVGTQINDIETSINGRPANDVLSETVAQNEVQLARMTDEDIDEAENIVANQRGNDGSSGGNGNNNGGRPSGTSNNGSGDGGNGNNNNDNWSFGDNDNYPNLTQWLTTLGRSDYTVSHEQAQIIDYLLGSMGGLTDEVVSELIDMSIHTILKLRRAAQYAQEADRAFLHVRRIIATNQPNMSTRITIAITEINNIRYISVSDLRDSDNVEFIYNILLKRYPRSTIIAPGKLGIATVISEKINIYDMFETLHVTIRNDNYIRDTLNEMFEGNQRNGIFTFSDLTNRQTLHKLRMNLETHMRNHYGIHLDSYISSYLHTFLLDGGTGTHAEPILRYYINSAEEVELTSLTEMGISNPTGPCENGMGRSGNPIPAGGCAQWFDTLRAEGQPIELAYWNSNQLYFHYENWPKP